jgi:hypothetical protein
MAAGPLGKSVEGPDGCVRGFLDQVDEENWRISDNGRTQTRLDRRTVLTLATDDLGSIARQTVLTIGEQDWRVQDLRWLGDGVTAACYLVAVA